MVIWFLIILVLVIFSGAWLGLAFTQTDPIAHFFTWIYFIFLAGLYSVIGVYIYRDGRGGEKK